MIAGEGIDRNDRPVFSTRRTIRIGTGIHGFNATLW